MNDTAVFAAQADLCRAMASTTRIEIVHLLRQGPQRVSDMAQATLHPQSTVSRHLAVLRNAGVVTAKRHGAEVIYEIANPKIADICNLMREVLAEEAAQRADLGLALKNEPP
jgi:ArsR family transcriptional regulator